MKKIVCPWVLISLLLIPQLSLAEMDITGIVHVSIDITDDGSTSSPVSDPGGVQVVSHKSRIAFNGHEELSPTLNLIWQYAAEFSADTGSFNGNTDDNDNKIDTQDSYIGLAGGIGTIKGGHMATPYRQSTDQLDIFIDTAADFNYIFGIGPISSNNHDLRTSNILAYESPGEKKLQGAAAYIADEDQDGVNDSGLSMSLNYNNQALYMTYSFQTLKRSGVGGEDDKGSKFGGGWNFGQGTRVGVIWESLDAGGVNNERDAYQLNISHLSGNTTFKFAYTVADEAGGVSNTGATNISLGLFHALSRTTEWYGLYTVTGNDALAVYGLETVPNGAIGEDVSAFSFGLKHEFSNL